MPRTSRGSCIARVTQYVLTFIVVGMAWCVLAVVTVGIVVMLLLAWVVGALGVLRDIAREQLQRNDVRERDAKGRAADWFRSYRMHNSTGLGTTKRGHSPRD